MMNLSGRTSALTLALALILALPACKKSTEADADKKKQTSASKDDGEKAEKEKPEEAEEKQQAVEEAPRQAPVPKAIDRSTKADSDATGKVVAKVGGIEITDIQVEKEMNRGGGIQNLSAGQQASRKRVVRELLVNQALIKVGAKNDGVEISDDELFAERERWVKEAGGEETFKAGLVARQLSEEEALDIMKATLLSRRLVQKRLPFEVDEEAIRAEYDKQKKDVKHGQKVRISEIFLPVIETAGEAMWDETMKQAEGILQEIKGGLDFAEAAKKYSKGPTAEKGGRRPALAGKKSGPKELFAPAFEMAVGDLYGPIRTKKGVYLAKVEEKIDSALGSIETQGVAIRKQLEMRSYDKNLKEVLEQLRKEFPVEYMD